MPTTLNLGEAVSKTKVTTIPGHSSWVREVSHASGMRCGVNNSTSPLLRLSPFTALKNPQHNSLRAHRLNDSKRGRHKKGSISISVTRSYSAIRVQADQEYLWYWVGTHEQYNVFTGSRRK
jgi:hypothetical protein